MAKLLADQITQGTWWHDRLGELIWILDRKDTYLAEIINADTEGHFAIKAERGANATAMARVPKFLKLLNQYRSDCETRLAALRAEMLPGKQTAEPAYCDDVRDQIEHWEATMIEIDKVIYAEN